MTYKKVEIKNFNDGGKMLLDSLIIDFLTNSNVVRETIKDEGIKKILQLRWSLGEDLLNISALSKKDWDIYCNDKIKEYRVLYPYTDRNS